MKKFFTFSAALLLGVCAFAGVSKVQEAKAAPLSEDQTTALKNLMKSYINTDGQYTKKSSIYLNGSAISEFATYFHAGATTLERATYYDEKVNALLMGDYDGTFTHIKSGYAKDGDNMDHYFYPGDGLSTADLYTYAEADSDYTVNNTSPNEYFVNLTKLADDIGDGSKWIAYQVNEANIYQYAVGEITLTDGEYNDPILKDFQYFAAPMLLQTGYFSYKFIEIDDRAGYLSIRIYLTDADEGKVTSEARGNEYLLCEAKVFKGLSFNPQANNNWYLLGTMNSWVSSDNNYLLERGTKTNEVEGNGVDAQKDGKDQYFIKDVELEADDEIKFRRGDSSWYIPGGANYKITEDGTYDFYFVPDGEIDDWSDNGGYFYVHKHPVTEGWKAVVNSTDQAVSVNPSNEDEIMLEVHLNENDKIVFTNGTKTLNYANVKDGCAALFDDGTGHELVAKDAGTYTFYVDLTAETKAIWASVDLDVQPSVVVHAYIKGGSSITWWTSNSAFICAEVEINGVKSIVAVTYVDTYDDGKTIEYTLEVSEQPTTVKLFRCNPTIVTELPTSAPSEGVWNSTNAGTVGNNAGFVYVDLGIA